MYSVYKVEIGQYVYVGCTNNLRRRKDQHNENARKRKSKFGCFLSDNGIVLHETDMVTMYEYEDRSEALKAEKKVTKEYEKNGALLLNDNYSKNCTRKGKNLGNTSKDYVVVDMQEHIATEVRDLRQYGIKIGVNYKDLHTTIKGGFCRKRYKVFTPKGWESVKDKELWITGEIQNVRRENITKKLVNRNAKRYIVLTPSNEQIEVYNLTAFAKERGINDGNLHDTFNHPTHRASGYKVIKRI